MFEKKCWETNLRSRTSKPRVVEKVSGTSPNNSPPYKEGKAANCDTESTRHTDSIHMIDSPPTHRPAIPPYSLS